MVSTIDGALYNRALHISNKLDVNTLIEDRNSQSEGISGHLERVTKLVILSGSPNLLGAPE